ncbi:MAG: Smr/MutS family protein [Prevotellaceae bacterium]|jgi:DNA mismatch repair protein MutS2|nr:Smr/MutS family protein [Prevotellaceae bacterium]
MKHLEQKIGFDQIRSSVAERCASCAGREKVDAISFCSDFALLHQRLLLCDEMRTICMLENSFPDTGFADTLHFLKQLDSPVYFIDTYSLVQLQIAQHTLRGVVRFFEKAKEGAYPKLRSLTQTVQLYPEVGRRLELLLDKFGEIRDNASPALQEIRRSIREKEQSMSKRIHAILRSVQEEGLADEEASVSIRDGRMVIPVASANKRKVKGFVYDESASGKTSFIEPFEIVELNNQVRELRFAEQREIVKILIAFSDFLRPYAPELIASADFLAEIDFIRAKALVAIQMEAGCPVLLPEPGVRLQKARHPILQAALKKEQKEIVPLSLALTPEKRILLISGPNAGGKSVCLKTVGLLQYMLQCGLLIPASESSEMGIFSSILMDIGDEQSIENDLSTYSSHLLNMKKSLEEATPSSLLLIDEFGAGTEPTAGGSIAEAILEQLEQSGCFGVITTHYTNLKFYATSSKGVLNGAMQFDVQNIRPLFKLETGVPGNSFAFELARKIGLPEPLLKRAEAHAGSGFVDLEKNLKGIARNRRNLEEKLARIKQTDKTLEKITDKYQTELEEISKMRKSIILEAKEEAKRIVNSANKQIENVIREIKESQANKERTKEARNQLDGLKEELEREADSDVDIKITQKMEQIRKRKERRAEKAALRALAPKAEASKSKPVTELPFAIGHIVRVKEGSFAGEIVRLKGKIATIGFGQMVTTSPVDKLERLSLNEYRALQPSAPAPNAQQSLGLSERRLNFKPSIDIRGQRLDDALDTVNRFVDDALMVGIGEVSILHGKGNGVLREEIRKYLRTIGGVASFGDDHVERGGAGITIVKLI